MLAGVCGGLARYFGIHPAFYRVGFVVLTLIGGAGILIYLAALARHPRRGQGGLDRRGDPPRARPPAGR
jgi:phage shock protein PspC (stress-responsive transcriptional regulator)